MNDIYGQRVYLNTPVRESGFSVLTTNRLLNSGIKTLRELVQKTEKGILMSRYFGKKSFDEIKARLSELNLHLGMSEADIKTFEIPETNNANVSELTMRDYFAGQAIIGMAGAHIQLGIIKMYTTEYARAAYMLADANVDFTPLGLHH
jgi:hypothetical protein